MTERDTIQKTMADIRKNSRTYAPLTDTCPMPIGKHAGIPMIDLPIDYLAKLYEIHLDAPRVYRGEHWIRVINWMQSKRDERI